MLENRTDEKVILDFINNFKNAQETFLNGCCFWFAFILQERFGGTMMYEPVENHYVQEIGGRLYDVSGDVTERYGSSKHLMRWADMEQFDSILYRRLIRDCIKKERYDWCPSWSIAGEAGLASSCKVLKIITLTMRVAMLIPRQSCCPAFPISC